MAAQSPPAAGKSDPRSISPVRGNDRRRDLGTFFDNVIKDVGGKEDKETAFVLVAHIVSTLLPFLSAIEKIGTIALIIPKSSHINERAYRDVLDKFRDQLIRNIAEEIKADASTNRDLVKENAVKLIDKALTKANKKKFVIIDIGGYFAPCLSQICESSEQKLMGIVEDTENGHQKYLVALEKQSQPVCPIVSVARNPLKKTEDYNVGKSIVAAADAILRTDADTMLTEMSIIGVIGFGKIGSSIAEHLRQKHVRQIFVYDRDGVQQMQAVSLGFSIATRPYLLGQSDMIFCATGNKSLSDRDFNFLKDNVFIVSCTSSDDEFDMEALKSSSPSPRKSPSGFTTKYVQDGKRINLLCDGNAVNFAYGAVNGPYIYSVQAGLLVAAIRLINEERKYFQQSSSQKKQPLCLSESDTSMIAKFWLNTFAGYEQGKNLNIDNEQFIATLSQSSNEVLKDTYLLLAVDLLRNSNYDELVASLCKMAIAIRQLSQQSGASQTYLKCKKFLDKHIDDAVRQVEMDRNISDLALNTAKLFNEKGFKLFAEHLQQRNWSTAAPKPDFSEEQEEAPPSYKPTGFY